MIGFGLVVASLVAGIVTLVVVGHNTPSYMAACLLYLVLASASYKDK